MNIGFLRETLASITHVKPLGRTFEINEVLYHLVGLVRYGDVLKLAVLHYDENFAEEAELFDEIAEAWEVNEVSAKEETNREFLRQNLNNHNGQRIHALQSIRFGEMEFSISEMETTPCDWQNWDIPVLLTEFLRQGWDPTGIDYQQIDNLFLTFARLEGEYASLPEIGENPEIRLTFRKEYISHLVEHPVILPVGTDYQGRLSFAGKYTGGSHWVHINRVYLMDIWEEMGKVFNDPSVIEQFSAAELAEHKELFERQLREICPPGMYFPVIEYESEEDLSLQFHTGEWLDATPECTNSCMGFSFKGEKKTGVLGLPLKVALIQEPMPQDCQVINAELFSFNLAMQQEEIIILPQ